MTYAVVDTLLITYNFPCNRKQRIISHNLCNPFINVCSGCFMYWITIAHRAMTGSKISNGFELAYHWVSGWLSESPAAECESLIQDIASNKNIYKVDDSIASITTALSASLGHFHWEPISGRSCLILTRKDALNDSIAALSIDLKCTKAGFVQSILTDLTLFTGINRKTTPSQ